MGRKKKTRLEIENEITTLLNETRPIKYTHNELKALWSRAQLFPILNQVADYLDKYEPYCDMLDKNDGLIDKTIEKDFLYEWTRLRNMYQNLLLPHKNRLIAELEGRHVYMNDDYYNALDETYSNWGNSYRNRKSC